MTQRLICTVTVIFGLLMSSELVVRAAVPEIQSFNIDLGQEFASDVAPFENGSRGIVLFVGTEPRRLALVDALSRSVVGGPEGAFDGNILPNGGAVVGRKLYVSGWLALMSVDLDTKIITTLHELPIGMGSSAVAPVAVSASRRYIFTIAAGHVLSVDTTTEEVVVLGEVEEGYYGIALSPDEQHVYVVDSLTGLLRRFDANQAVEPETSSFVTSTGIENTISRVGVASDGLIYVGYVGPEEGLPRFHISVLNPQGDLVLNRVYGFFSTGLDMTRDGKYLILGNGDFVDRMSLEVVAHAPTGRGGNEVHVTLDGRRAYVTNYNSQFLTVIDLESIPGSREVAIDVRPAGFPSRLGKSSLRLIPVAILSSADFDATTIDPSSVCFGSSANPDARSCGSARRTGKLADADGDGRTDLLLHFPAAETGIAPGDREACLTGRTYEGVSIEGCDSLRTRGR